MFEQQLKPGDISSERLVLGMGHVRILLPEINTTLELHFTDAQKDCCMKTKFNHKRDWSVVINGCNHFLFLYEKPENDGGSGTDLSQSGDDDGGSSSNVSIN